MTTLEQARVNQKKWIHIILTFIHFVFCVLYLNPATHLNDKRVRRRR
jgi:uncharacterized membrane protein